MSSPIASSRKNIVQDAVVRFHQKASHKNRVSILSTIIAEELNKKFGEKTINCLDVGCGDMTIAETIYAILPNTHWSCVDIHSIPEELAGSEKWKKYKVFDGSHLPYEDNSMDVIVFCDVLHHTSVSNQLTLLKEAARVAPAVIIKDHFEYSLYSRNILKLMDIIGNWGYGVEIPANYFTEDSFSNLLEQAHLKITGMVRGIELYAHLPVIRNISKPQWQFIAILAKD